MCGAGGPVSCPGHGDSVFIHTPKISTLNARDFCISHIPQQSKNSKKKKKAGGSPRCLRSIGDALWGQGGGWNCGGHGHGHIRGHVGGLVPVSHSRGQQCRCSPRTLAGRPGPGRGATPAQSRTWQCPRGQASARGQRPGPAQRRCRLRCVPPRPCCPPGTEPLVRGWGGTAGRPPPQNHRRGRRHSEREVGSAIRSCKL